jgi:hypothetical protein
MLTRSLAYFAAAQDPQALPLAAAILRTERGMRVWSDRALSNAETWQPNASEMADGTATADGTHVAGAQIEPILERSARLTDPGAPSEQLIAADQWDQFATAMSGRQVADLTIALNNGDRAMSQALAIESWLSGSLSLAFGYRGLMRQDWIERFRGVVERVEITREAVRLTARAS